MCPVIYAIAATKQYIIELKLYSRNILVAANNSSGYCSVVYNVYHNILFTLTDQLLLLNPVIKRIIAI